MKIFLFLKRILFPPLFLLFFLLFAFPQNIAADKGTFYFLEYGGLLFLRYFPLAGLAGIVKLYLLKRKFSLNLRNVGKITIKTAAEIYAEIIYFLLLFFLLSPVLSGKIFTKIVWIDSLVKNSEAVKLLFIIIILLPLQCLLAAILNLVLLYSYWSARMEKSFKDFSYAFFLSLIFPGILIIFVVVGIFLKHPTPLL